MLHRSLVIAIVAGALSAAPLAVQAKSKNNSHSEKGAANHAVSSGSNQAKKKADQKQAKKAKKRKPIDGDSSDYLKVDLKDASVVEYQ
jgi:Ni/Co efflux regulator RcnB